jgi:septal ring-binding cell division protein DamX
MTKAELIRKLARKAGVADPEAKIFFEIFLQQCAFLLNPGEAVNINGLGFFKFKKGKFISLSTSSSTESDSSILSDFIVYTPAEKISDESDDNLVFNIPAVKETEYNVIDSYFSLSIGKPVIPLRGAKNTEFFIPLAGSEQRRLLESKVENILARADIIKDYIKGSEFLLITPESYSAKQFEISWEEKTERKNENTFSNNNKMSWDFGDEISRQIEEDSLLDVDKEDFTNTVEEEGHISWDFGVQNEIEPGIPVFERTTEPEIQPLPESQPEAEPLNQNIADESAVDITQVKNFQRIQSFTREHKHKPGTEENLSWNFGAEKENKQQELNESPDFYSHYEETVKDENGFVQVPNKRKTYDIELSKHDQAKLDSVIQEQVDAEHAADADVTSGFYKDEAEKQPEEQTATSVPQQKEYYSGRRSTPVFIIAIVVIVIVGTAFFFFLKNSSLFQSGKNKADNPEIQPKVTAAIINRTYDIPVTYPYTSGNDSAGKAVSVMKIEKATEPEKKFEPVKEADTKPVKEVQAPSYRIANGDFKKVKENIYLEGNTYTVQLSSWKSKAKAVGEVKKLRNKGLSAFVEEVTLPGRGIWYRVKIGNFRTQSEAEKYLQ